MNLDHVWCLSFLNFVVHFQIECAKKNIDDANQKMHEKLCFVMDWRVNGHTSDKYDAVVGYQHSYCIGFEFFTVESSMERVLVQHATGNGRREGRLPLLGSKDIVVVVLGTVMMMEAGMVTQSQECQHDIAPLD